MQGRLVVRFHFLDGRLELGKMLHGHVAFVPYLVTRQDVAQEMEGN